MKGRIIVDSGGKLLTAADELGQASTQPKAGALQRPIRTRGARLGAGRGSASARSAA